MLEHIAHFGALSELKILLIVALCLLFSPYIAKFLRLSVSAVEIMLGAAAAALGLVGESENFRLLANVGFWYLMFMAGMEANLRVFLALGRSFLRRAVIYIALLYLLSTLAVSLSGASGIFIIVLPVMSVGLLGVVIKDFGRAYEWLNISFLVATLAEVVSIVLLTIVAAFLSEHSLLDIAKSLAYLVLFLALCLLAFKALRVVFWHYPNLRLIIMPWHDKDEKDIRFCMGILILVICAMMLSNLEIALGAFIAGVFIATFFDHKHDLERKLSGFGFGFLIPIFFIYIGSTFDIKALSDSTVLKNAFAIFGAMLALRLLCSLVFLKKFRLKNTLLFALSHSMPLTLLIATATLLHSAKLIENSLYAAFILTALLEAVVVMSFIKILMQWKRG